jgi:hypothetical protein
MLGCSAAWRSDGRELAVATLVDCPGSRESAGQIFVVDPNKPVEPRLITGAGAHPAWEPVQLQRSGALP